MLADRGWSQLLRMQERQGDGQCGVGGARVTEWPMRPRRSQGDTGEARAAEEVRPGVRGEARAAE